MRMKTLKQKILELPDTLQVTKVHIECINKHGESQVIEFEISKNKLITTEGENEEN
jgi:hypothetical protein